MSQDPHRWLPADFEHPLRVDLGTGHHLRPIGPDDTDLDMVAVMSSRERLFSVYGAAWGWPPETMTAAQDREDLQHHADETAAHESFNYALLDADETVLVGVRLPRPAREGRRRRRGDLLVGGRRLGRHRGGGGARRVRAPLDRRGLAAAHPRYVGRDLSWDAWLALDPLP